MAQSTRSTFLGVRNPMAHYIPLWVIVVFVFFVVVLCTMGGLQEGLAKRQFPDTKVNGDLEVTDAFTRGDIKLHYISTTTGADLGFGNAAGNADTVTVGIQPAGTYIHSLTITGLDGGTTDASIVTAANANSGLAVEVGTTAGGNEITSGSLVVTGGGQITIVRPNASIIQDGTFARANTLLNRTNTAFPQAQFGLASGTFAPTARTIFVGFFSIDGNAITSAPRFRISATFAEPV